MTTITRQKGKNIFLTGIIFCVILGNNEKT